jgi:EAL domain-containing protein (putative c-di-GMP-specific phosphodiesterase class I)/sensor domain CHASE-containing protein
VQRAALEALIRRTARAPWDPATVVAAGITLLVLALWLLQADAPRAHASAAPVDTRAVDERLAAIRERWVAEAQRLREQVRERAVHDATYEFVRRPNFPYVDDYFSPAKLAALAVDTVLIVDREARPIFWRRPDDPDNQGFPDAELFLAQLPELPAPRTRAQRGEPVFEGFVQFRGEPELVSVIAIEPPSGDGVPRGYLIYGRGLDGAVAQRVLEGAPAGIDVMPAGDALLPAAASIRLDRSLVPVVVVDEQRIRGYLPLVDAQGRLLRVYAASAAKPPAPATASAAGASRSSWSAVLGATLLLLIGGVGAWWAFARARRQPVATAADDARADGLADVRAGEPADARAAGVDGGVDAAAPVDPEPVAPESPHAATPGARPPSGDGDDEWLIAMPEDPPRTPAAASEDFHVDLEAATSPQDASSVDEAANRDPPDGHAAAPPQRAEPDTAAAEPFLTAADAPVMSAAAVPAERPSTAAAQHEPQGAVVRRLLEEGRLRVHYQPQIGTANGTIVGVEALVRWQDDAAALRAAGELFGDGTSADSFAGATEFVLRRACADRRDWLRQLGRTLPVSVNVGLAELCEPGFVPSVLRILEQSDLPAAYLELEVPERALAAPGSAALEALEHAYRSGIGIAIGGFVAADAPLRALTQIPVAKLKLHRSLVADLPDDTHARMVVDAVLAIGRTLGVAVCAEGVERPAQAAYLEGRQCPVVQGWHYGRALDADQFFARLKGTGVDTVRLPLMDVEELEAHARAAGVV